MLEHQDYLALVAELAVALAGFTGVVAVFRTEPANRSRLGAIGFFTMLRASLTAMLLSILPYVAFTLIGNVELTWLLGNIAVAVFMGAHLYLFITTGGVRNSSGLGLYLLFPGGLCVWLVNVLAIFKITEPAAMFVLAVSWMLLVSVHNFGMLIISSNPLDSFDDHSGQ